MQCFPVQQRETRRWSFTGKRFLESFATRRAGIQTDKEGNTHRPQRWTKAKLQSFDDKIDGSIDPRRETFSNRKESSELAGLSPYASINLVPLISIEFRDCVSLFYPRARDERVFSRFAACTCGFVLSMSSISYSFRVFLSFSLSPSLSLSLSLNLTEWTLCLCVCK